MRTLLKDRRVPISEVRFFPSSRSAGQRLPWGDNQVIVEDTATRSAAATVEQTDWGLVIIDEAHRVGAAPYVRDDFQLFLRLLDHDHFEDKYRESVHDQYDGTSVPDESRKTSSALRADRCSRLGSRDCSRMS